VRAKAEADGIGEFDLGIESVRLSVWLPGKRGSGAPAEEKLFGSEESEEWAKDVRPVRAARYSIIREVAIFFRAEPVVFSRCQLK
jgi:hypothetical protein